jgi:hypothetical protein
MSKSREGGGLERARGGGEMKRVRQTGAEGSQSGEVNVLATLVVLKVLKSREKLREMRS